MNYNSRKKSKIQRLKPALIIIGALVIIAAAVFYFIYNHKPDIVQSCIYVEAGGQMPDATALLMQDAELPEDPIICAPSLESLDTSKLAHYSITVTIGRFEYQSQIVIRDTVPPTGTLQPVTKPYNTQVNAEEFVVSYDDVTAVSIRYGAPINYKTVGDQEVTIELVDESRNVTKLTTTLTIYQDTTPPVIEGVKDIHTTIGDTIEYKANITVTDDYDAAPTLEVDNSTVKIDTAGVYEITYTATDASGNTTQEGAKVYIAAPDPGADNSGKLEQLVNAALEECLSDRSNDYQVLYDIFWWIKNNTSFITHSDKSSEINAAIEGLENHRGDCYVYYAMLKKMMEACGFEVLGVERVGGESNHYWCLVKYKGAWYHIDACPRSLDHEKYWYCFLRTDDEVLNETINIGDKYYNFDTSLYPASATTKLEIGWRNN